VNYKEVNVKSDRQLKVLLGSITKWANTLPLLKLQMRFHGYHFDESQTTFELWKRGFGPDDSFVCAHYTLVKVAGGRLKKFSRQVIVFVLSALISYRHGYKINFDFESLAEGIGVWNYCPMCEAAMANNWREQTPVLN